MKNGVLYYVYRHADDPDRTVIAEKNVSAIRLWLAGATGRPLYALRINWRWGVNRA